MANGLCISLPVLAFPVIPRPTTVDSAALFTGFRWASAKSAAWPQPVSRSGWPDCKATKHGWRIRLGLYERKSGPSRRSR